MSGTPAAPPRSPPLAPSVLPEKKSPGEKRSLAKIVAQDAIAITAAASAEPARKPTRRRGVAGGGGSALGYRFASAVFQGHGGYPCSMATRWRTMELQTSTIITKTMRK